MPSSDKVTLTIKCETTKEHLKGYTTNKSGLPSSNEYNNLLIAIEDDEGALDSIRVKYEDVHEGPNPNFQKVHQVMATLACLDPDARVEIWQMDPTPQHIAETEPQYIEAIAPAGEDHRLGIVMIYVR